MEFTVTNITHNRDKSRFIINVESHEAVLEYQLLAGDRIDFSRTFVAVELRGYGLAEKLVRQGLSWAREQGYSIQASCWYVAKFLPK